MAAAKALVSERSTARSQEQVWKLLPRCPFCLQSSHPLVCRCLLVPGLSPSSAAEDIRHQSIYLTRRFLNLFQMFFSRESNLLSVKTRVFPCLFRQGLVCRCTGDRWSSVRFCCVGEGKRSLPSPGELWWVWSRAPKQRVAVKHVCGWSCWDKPQAVEPEFR